MRVDEIMTRDVKTCLADTNLAAVAALMWDNDCGVVPVVNSARRVVGVITDRDICIALGTRDVRPSEVTAGEVISGEIYTCCPDDDVRTALATMRKAKVRRLVVVNDQTALVGILSLSDLVRYRVRARNRKIPGLTRESIISVVADIGQPPNQRLRNASVLARLVA
jgi:CBS domain-containing protein